MAKSLTKLGAQAYGPMSQDPKGDLLKTEVALSFSLPTSLAAVLIEYGTTISFENGASFIPNEPTGLENEMGYQAIDFLYGITGSDTGLRACYSVYKERLPHNLRPIGASCGGDQICIDTTSGCILYWRHDVPHNTPSLYMIASDIDEFISILVPDFDDMDDSDSGIVEDNSFLDF